MKLCLQGNNTLLDPRRDKWPGVLLGGLELVSKDPPVIKLQGSGSVVCWWRREHVVQVLDSNVFPETLLDTQALRILEHHPLDLKTADPFLELRIIRVCKHQ